MLSRGEPTAFDLLEKRRQVADQEHRSGRFPAVAHHADKGERTVIHIDQYTTCVQRLINHLRTKASHDPTMS